MGHTALHTEHYPIMLGKLLSHNVLYTLLLSEMALRLSNLSNRSYSICTVKEQHGEDTKENQVRLAIPT